MNVSLEASDMAGDLSSAKGLSVKLHMKMVSLVEASAPGNVRARQ